MSTNEYESQIIARQKILSEILGVSGSEEKVVKQIIVEIKPYVDNYWVDETGNLLAVIEGPPGSSAILLDAHTDEIGFMITHIDDSGFAYFTTVGGWDERMFLGQSVIVEPNEERLFGVVGALPPHILTPEKRKEPVSVDNLFLDFGFMSKEEAEKKGVTIGTVGTLYSGFQELPYGRLKGKAFDDRSGCNILIQTAINLKGKELPYTVCLAFSTQEEVGIRGARTAAYTFADLYDIKMAIACENTTAGDVPKVPSHKCPSKMGKGPAITILDSSMIASKKVRERLVSVAKEKEILYQFKVPSRGGTDAGIIHLTKRGIPSGVVSVPGRYIHSPCTIIDKRDLLNAIDLVTAFALKKD
ncbi:MAG: M42 family metallopeptidase [Candidatus Kariarchaeaceae archaeon]